MTTASTWSSWKQRFEPFIAWCGDRTSNIGTSLILVGLVNAGVAIAQLAKLFDQHQHISEMEIPVIAGWKPCSLVWNTASSQRGIKLTSSTRTSLPSAGCHGRHIPARCLQNTIHGSWIACLYTQAFRWQNLTRILKRHLFASQTNNCFKLIMKKGMYLPVRKHYCFRLNNLSRYVLNFIESRLSLMDHPLKHLVSTVFNRRVFVLMNSYATTGISQTANSKELLVINAKIKNRSQSRTGNHPANK